MKKSKIFAISAFFTFGLILTSCLITGADDGKTNKRYLGKFTPDADYVLSGKLHQDLPPLPKVPYNLEAPGFAAERLSKVPAPGIHPRVVLSPEDLELIRKTYDLGDKANKVFKITVKDMRYKAAHEEPYRPDYSNAPWKGINAVTCRLLLAQLDNDEKAGKEAVKMVMEHARFLEPMIDLLNNSKESQVWKDNFYYFSRTGIRVGGIPYVEAYHQGGKGKVEELAQKEVEFTGQDNQYAYTSLGMEYDYGYRFMTDEERDYVRKVIAKSTAGKYTTGMELPGHMFINNHMSMGAEFLTLALAIEGEEGYDPRIIKAYTPRLIDKMTYDISPDGVLFENVKGFIPIYPIWAAGRRGKRNLLRHDHLIAMMTAKVQNTQNLYDRFIARGRNRPGYRLPEVGKGGQEERHWTVGTGSGPGGDASFFWNWLLRYFYPEDKVIDFAYHITLSTQSYDCFDGSLQGKEKDGRNYGGKIHYNMRSMSDLMLLTSSQDEGVEISNPDKLPKYITDRPLAWGDLYRGLGVARSSWDKDATFIHYECRSDTYHGGHETPEYGDFTLSADGIVWSPYTGAYMDCYFRNMVLIDGLAGVYPHATAKMMSVENNDDGATFVSDATHGYNWRMTGGIWELDHPCMETPFLRAWKQSGYSASRTTEISPHPVMRGFYEGFASLDWGPWHGENRGPIRLKQWNNVDHVFRTLHLARGKHPYILICDNVKQDDKVHQFDWCLNLIGEAVLVNADSAARNRHLQKNADGTIQADLLLTIGDASEQRESRSIFGSSIPHIAPQPKPGDPMLLVRVLWRNTNFAYPLPSFEEAWKFKRVKIPALAVEPEFKVMVYPHKYGDPLPFTKWNDDRSQLTVRIDDQNDLYTFGKTDRGRTVFARERDGKVVSRSDTVPAAPMLVNDRTWTVDGNFPDTIRKVLFNGETKVELDMPTVGTAVHYTLDPPSPDGSGAADGSMPTEKSPVYSGPIKLNKSVVLKASAKAAYWPFGKDSMSKPLVVEFEKQEPLAGVTLPKDAVTGLACDVFEERQDLYNETGHFTGKKIMLPDLDNCQVRDRFLTNGFEIPRLQPNAPAIETRAAHYRYRGYLNVPKTGSYGFKVNSCAPVKFSIGDRSVINVVLPFGLSQKDRCGEAVLAAGSHPFELIVTDPVFWKGELEEPYRIKVEMIGPDESKYAAIPTTGLATDAKGLQRQSLPSSEELQPIPEVKLPELSQGLVRYAYDRVSQAPQDYKIPFAGLSPELLKVDHDEKAYTVEAVRAPEENDYLGRLVDYHGYLHIDQPGEYAFELDREGANQLKLGDHIVANNRLAGRQRCLPIKLSPGYYPVTLSIAKGTASCKIKGPRSENFVPISMGAWFRPVKTEARKIEAPVLLVSGKLNAKGEAEFTARGQDTVVRIQGAQPVQGPDGPAIKLSGKESRLTVEGLHMPEDQATIAMWIKPAKKGEYFLLSEQFLGCYIRLRGEVIWAAFYRDEVARTDKIIIPDRWNHLVVRFSDTVDVFVNGKLVKSVTASKADYQSDCHKRIMTFFGDELNRGVFAGAFADLRVYNRLLSEKEISSLTEHGRIPE